MATSTCLCFSLFLLLLVLSPSNSANAGDGVSVTAASKSKTSQHAAAAAVESARIWRRPKRDDGATATANARRPRDQFSPVDQLRLWSCRVSSVTGTERLADTSLPADDLELGQIWHTRWRNESHACMMFGQLEEQVEREKVWLSIPVCFILSL